MIPKSVGIFVGISLTRRFWRGSMPTKCQQKNFLPTIFSGRWRTKTLDASH
jgi:hypothetical protein